MTSNEKLKLCFRVVHQSILYLVTIYKVATNGENEWHNKLSG